MRMELQRRKPQRASALAAGVGYGEGVGLGGLKLLVFNLKQIEL